MRVLVVSNCVTQTFAQTLQAIFPAWEVRGAGLGESRTWVESNVKPAFTRYARGCDLYFGWSLDDHPLKTILPEQTPRIVVPEIRFRGFHPDLASLPGFRGPFGLTAFGDQVSLIAVAAKALGYDQEQTARLFDDRTYQRLGYPDFYASERARFIQMLAQAGIDIAAEFTEWEQPGDAFFFVPHHARAHVLVDIVRRALHGKYLDDAGFVRTAALRTRLKDNLAWSEVWPVYPQLAARLGVPGSLTWLLPTNPGHRELSLAQIIEMTFAGLDAHEGDWRREPFVEQAVAILADLA
jgi:hypothetical protein